MRILYVTEYFLHENITGGFEAGTHHPTKYPPENCGDSVIYPEQGGQDQKSEVNNGIRISLDLLKQEVRGL